VNDFTAVNDVEIRFVPTVIGARMVVTDPDPANVPRQDLVRIESWLDPRQVDALREFFRHEEDERLGRWRWPEYPEYTAYPRPDGYVRVLREEDGTSEVFLRQDVEADGGNLPALAARAFFAAHPEAKPWHDAKPDEVWALTLHGKEIAYIRIDDPDIGEWASVSPNEHARFLALNAFGLTAGRRIWPEDAS
jgi:hypothetical protein